METDTDIRNLPPGHRLGYWNVIVRLRSRSRYESHYHIVRVERQRNTRGPAEMTRVCMAAIQQLRERGDDLDLTPIGISFEEDAVYELHQVKEWSQGPYLQGRLQ